MFHMKHRKEGIMNIIKRAELDRIPCDKKFSWNGNEEFFHATGYEVLIDDLGDEPSWWNEYVSPDGETYEYGR